MHKEEPNNGSKVVRVTDQAYERAEAIVAGMQARGLSVNKKSIVSELIMLCPIPQPIPQPQPVEKKRRTRKESISTAAAL